ncbi:hypothetical protein U8Y98_11540 [Priestia megaterium]|uniref:hypothetical protein n=2 Tax=Priestia megaterium TaxID=1404 RepID=UPI002FE0C021
MMKIDYRQLGITIRHKLANDESSITKEELNTAAKLAKATGRMQDKILYVNIKSKLKKMEEMKNES